MLLRRMDSHPEEFNDVRDPYNEERGKWTPIMNELAHRIEIIDADNGNKDISNGLRIGRRMKPLGYLSDEEVIRIHTKLMQVQRDLFDQRVMKALLTGQDEQVGVFNETTLAQASAAITSPYGKSY